MSTSGLDATALTIDGHVTLRGGGKVVLSGDFQFSGDTVVGSLIAPGDAGGGEYLALSNKTHGVINADVNGHIMWLASAGNKMANAGLLKATNGGTLVVDTDVRNSGAIVAGDLSVVELDGKISGNGQLQARGSGRLVAADSVTGNGTSALADHSTIEFQAASSHRVVFDSSAQATLAQGDPGHFSGTIAGFGEDDLIDFTNLQFVAGSTTANFVGTSTGGTLHVETPGFGSYHVTLLGNCLSSAFVAHDDGHGGTSVSDPVGEPPAITLGSS